MADLDVILGDAVFVVDMRTQGWTPTSLWKDTAHFHADFEAHILLSGSAIIEIEGKDVRLDAGDICLLAPNVSHYPQNGSSELKRMVFSFNVAQNHAAYDPQKRFSEYLYYGNLFQSLKGYFVVNDARLIAIMESLMAEEYTSETEHIYSNFMASFFINVAKRMQQQLLDKERRMNGGYVSENTLNQRKTVEEFFQKNYDQNIRIEDLAKKLCLSVPQTHRVVKKIFNAGFQKTLMKQRMEHACMLIKQHTVSLEEVAYLCGYTSYNGFLSAFKSHTGKTPKEYEKSVR